MDISLKHEDYKTLKILADNTIEEVVECELALPEYMPEVLRIVKSVAKPKINSCRLVGERVTVDGLCEFKMIYVAEDGCLYVYTQTCSFNVYKDDVAFGDAIDITAGVKVSYVNCRATGTKRADIKAGLGIKINAYCQEITEVISIDEESCIEQKTVPVRAMSIGCRKTGQFAMSDTFSLESGCAFVLSYSASAVCTDVKKINNKLMVKGETIVDICYVTADDKSKTKKIRHILPINQIMEIEGMEERFTGFVFLNVSSVDVVPKGESAGASSTFEISLGIDASVTMWEEKELLVISDAYAINKTLELKKTPCRFYGALSEIRETITAGSDFNTTDGGVEILDCCGEITSINTKFENGKLIISGSVAASVIVRDNNSNITNVSKMVDFSYNREIVDCAGTPVCNPDVTLISLDCVSSLSGAEIRAELNVQCSVFEEISVDTITHITLSDTVVDVRRNAITVYFPECENESLWSIARRYNTTVSAIACENDLDGDTTEKLRVLFIPAV